MIAATFREGSFRDKVALVSGGTSGIGAAIGNALAELGARVTVTGATMAEAEEARARAGSRGSPSRWRSRTLPTASV